MEDQRQETIQEPVKQEVLPVKKQKGISKQVSRLLGGEYLSNKSVMGNLYFLVYLGVLAMLYIANTYYAEKTFKEIERIKTELKEYRFQYLTTKSALMFHSQQSEIAKRAVTYGLKITTLPPYKIFYTESSIKSISGATRKNP